MIGAGQLQAPPTLATIDGRHKKRGDPLAAPIVFKRDSWQMNHNTNLINYPNSKKITVA